MGQTERAAELIKLSGIDYLAAEKLSESGSEFEFIIGFHLQQAAEKLLKAWLEILEQEYPKTHDLTLLLSLLEDQGNDIGIWWDLTLLMPYAVNLRYEDDLDHFPDMSIMFDLVRNLREKIDTL